MLLSAEDIYRSLAELLLQESNLKFARLMVETLNTILLTTSELFDLRNRLRNLSSQVKLSSKLRRKTLPIIFYVDLRLTFYVFLSGKLRVIYKFVPYLESQPHSNNRALLINRMLPTCW